MISAFHRVIRISRTIKIQQGKDSKKGKNHGSGFGTDQ
jgi:hypothetical protein